VQLVAAKPRGAGSLRAVTEIRKLEVANCDLERLKVVTNCDHLWEKGEKWKGKWQ
jgi:hypothetical protein